ncbi:DUF6622 family protein [Leuconostoc pseudomesenteroides]|uniref:DUF6622 family protein n=1 Tax=Leuconostoc pseudomesenteroides TaxID=33968 RepID=UPI0011242930|nr:DUF6622 family protein [Leuconostoc pseudomesenteroides]MCT4388143.1 DUF1453 family protein [Leuconostoc pseudomesenteroides]TOZ01401.1 DUF1453 domain-containing protein [Leuconostoc pseudomesenteroides]
MANILEIIFQIIHNTPFWVWVVLLILVKRGTALMHDGPSSLGKSVIMPLIFIVWGLNTVVTKFADPDVILGFYIVSLLPGFLLSYLLYMNRKFYVENGQLVQAGSKLPITIMLSNFFVKYFLNVLTAMHPALYNQMQFNIFYGIISGFTVGLFFGGIYKTLTAQKQMFTTK